MIERNQVKNDKRSFIDNPYLFLATHFVYNYTHYQTISATDFFKRSSLEHLTYNCCINTITVTITDIILK